MMEQDETIFGWQNLWMLALFLLVLYGLIYLLKLAMERYMAQNRIGNRLKLSSKRFELFYIPTAWLILILGFIAINPIWHGIFAGVVGIFTFPYLRNYVSGLFLKANPMLEVGALVQNEGTRGLINRVSRLGLILGTDTGEQFVWYRDFERMGFAVIAQETNQQLQSIYIKSEKTAAQILDILFDHPVLSFGNSSSLRATKSKDVFLYQFTLEQGAQIEDLSIYLAGHEIETSQTDKFE
mgnify:CR=1 FL=1